MEGPGFDEFAATRGDALLRFAYLLCGDAHLAEDIVQSVLARAYRRWPKPEAYVRAMVVNEHLSWRRRRASRELVVAATPDGPARDGADLGERDAAWRLLATLPRRQRAVLVLRYYEDLSDAAIADVLGCSVSAVRAYASRGLATLRLDQEEARRAR